VNFISIVCLMGRIALCGIFAVAGVLKLSNRGSSIEATIAFGVPRALASPIAIGLPLAELAAAALLLPSSTAWFGALLSLTLLLIFLAGIISNLARGRAPPCNCFGQSSSTPIGVHTLVRNLLLALVAGVVVWYGKQVPPLSLMALFDSFTAAQVVGGLIALAFLVSTAVALVLLIQILRQQGRIVVRLDAIEERLPGTRTVAASKVMAPSRSGLDVGTRAPRFSAGNLEGRVITFEELMSQRKPLLLLFTNPGCAPCNALLPEVVEWCSAYQDRLSMWLVSEGTLQDNRSKGINNVLLQSKREIAEAYEAWGTPAAVLIRIDGTVGSALAQGADAIRHLVAESANSAALQAQGRAVHRQTGLATGDPVPALDLRDIDGKRSKLSDYRGRDIVLLFWNPACGYCNAMFDELKEWDARQAPHSPNILIFSAGSDAEIRAMGLRSPLFSDPHLTIGNTFGANGTPMAIEVDAEGRVASEIVAGKQRVLEVISRRSMRAQ
jgi:peroxiredoxin